MRSRDEDPDLLYVIKFLAAEDIPGLPPGGGITSKSVYALTHPLDCSLTAKSKDSDIESFVSLSADETA